jgi:NAD(P)-dependent dehydrogenase (short-subunit alcohol dehydrogenase family)
MTGRVSDLHRTAFVTGASTGLGRAFAEMLLADGVEVWGTSRDAARLAPVAGAHAGKFHPVVLELADGDAAEVAFEKAATGAGGFDLVINNAGFGLFAEFAAVEFAVWRDQLEIMLVNTLRLSHAALRHFRQGSGGTPRGTLVNISSLAAEFPLPYQSAYNVAKAGLSAFNESAMIETAGTAVVIIDFQPGDFRTDFDGAVRRPQANPTPRMQGAWQAFEAMMRSGPPPTEAAAALRRALLRHRSGTVRCGRFFQAILAPFLTRFGSQGLVRRIHARYFNLS